MISGIECSIANILLKNMTGQVFGELLVIERAGGDMRRGCASAVAGRLSRWRGLIYGEGSYAPGNCRWATAAEQRRNSSDVIVVEIALYELDAGVGSDGCPVSVCKQGWSLGRVLGGRRGGSSDNAD